MDDEAARGTDFDDICYAERLPYGGRTNCTRCVLFVEDVFDGCLAVKALGTQTKPESLFEDGPVSPFSRRHRPAPPPGHPIQDTLVGWPGGGAGRQRHFQTDTEIEEVEAVALLLGRREDICHTVSEAVRAAKESIGEIVKHGPGVVLSEAWSMARRGLQWFVT